MALPAARELCSLGGAYATWIRANERLLAPIASEAGGGARLNVALLGCTVRESAALLGALGEVVGPTCACLVAPLGDASGPYRFCHERLKAAEDAKSVAADLRGALSAGGVQGINVEAEVSGWHVRNLKEGEHDLVIFGPLAFGVLNEGRGAFDAATRAEMVREALAKTRADTGRVLFSTRQVTPWQEELYQGTFDALGGALEASLKLLAADSAPLFYRRFDLRADLEIEASQPSLLASLLSIGSYNRCALEGGASSDRSSLFRSLEQHGRPGAAAGLTLLEERASLYVAAREALGSAVEDAAQDTARNQAAPGGLGGGGADGDAAPSGDMWWPQGREGDFFNVGFDIWQRQRAEWRRAREDVDPPQAAPVPYEEVIAGLASLRRTYELPHPIRLPDLIDIYLDIWESQDGY